jgi:DNA repair exonuclease SbcCD ATPase subunit
MEQILDRLRYITSDVQELVGVVTFGQSRLQQFHDALDTLENDISTIKHYRHYQTCTEEHRRVQAMLNTTLESLISWRSLALQHLQELNELPIHVDHAGHFILQMTMQQVNRLIKDLHLHIQQLQQMQMRLANFSQQLNLQKRALPA